MASGTLNHNVIETVEVTHEGQTYPCSYYVENGVIHAAINGKTMMLPVGRQAAAQATVRALVTRNLACSDGQDLFRSA